MKGWLFAMDGAEVEWFTAFINADSIHHRGLLAHTFWFRRSKFRFSAISLRFCFSIEIYDCHECTHISSRKKQTPIPLTPYLSIPLLNPYIPYFPSVPRNPTRAPPCPNPSTPVFIPHQRRKQKSLPRFIFSIGGRGVVSCIQAGGEMAG